jgi:hypothetical protein
MLLARVLFVLLTISIVTPVVYLFDLGSTRAIFRSARLDDWRQAPIRPICHRALQTRERDPLLPNLPGGSHRIDFNDFTRAREMTAELNCYIASDPDAICETNNRAYIAGYTNQYFAHMNAMLALARRYGDEELRTVQELWDNPRNRAIARALESNIRAGRLTTADFGSSVPAALKVQLDRFAGARDTCKTMATAKGS